VAVFTGRFYFQTTTDNPLTPPRILALAAGKLEGDSVYEKRGHFSCVGPNLWDTLWNNRCVILGQKQEEQENSQP
jgi:hypothetical protein